MTSILAPLEGLIVLDLTRVLSGPYATLMLADAGARVIKVEPHGGEHTRNLGPFVVEPDGSLLSTYFLRLNRHKENISLDLKTKAGKEQFINIVRKADVIVENFRASVMDGLGLGAKDLICVNPRLIYCSISGFGHTESPYIKWPAFNLVVEAMTSSVAKQPTDQSGPLSIGPPLGDTFASMRAVIGILLAIERRRKTNVGSIIDISMYDSAVALNEMSLNVAALTGQEMRYNETPGMHKAPDLAPYGYFRVADGWLCIAVGADDQWPKLAAVMGRDDLGTDARLYTGADRVRNFTELVKGPLEEWLSKQTKEIAAALLAEKGVPAAPFRTPVETVGATETKARGNLVTVKTPGGGRYETVNTAIRMLPSYDLGDASIRELGVDTERILAEFQSDSMLSSSEQRRS